jgi:hypothetical protein
VCAASSQLIIAREGATLSTIWRTSQLCGAFTGMCAKRLHFVFVLFEERCFVRDNAHFKLAYIIYYFQVLFISTITPCFTQLYEHQKSKKTVKASKNITYKVKDVIK